MPYYALSNRHRHTSGLAAESMTARSVCMNSSSVPGKVEPKRNTGNALGKNFPFKAGRPPVDVVSFPPTRAGVDVRVRVKSHVGDLLDSEVYTQ